MLQVNKHNLGPEIGNEKIAYKKYSNSFKDLTRITGNWK